MIIITKIIFPIIIIVMIFSFGGCKKTPPPPQKPAAETPAKPAQAKPAETLEPKKIEIEEYAYDAKGRRDPFLSLVVVAKQKATKKKGASPMESYAVEEVKLLAIAWDKDKYYALIRLPDRKTYTITEGMTLGLQGGKVTSITKNSVTIREFIEDYKGDIKPRDSILKLHKGEEE